MDGFEVRTLILNSYQQNVISYYHEELAERGWDEIIAASAYGQGGETNVYKKEGR